MQAKTIKPFPWMCPECHVKSVILQRRDYRATAVHDTESYEIVVAGIEIPTCSRCGSGLLTPEQIKAQRESLGLTQAELAMTLRVSEAALARWETGMQLQSKAVDLLLRLYLGSADVRRACTENVENAHVGDLATSAS
jgi:DNA-binding XRE family transcriptional regulator